MQVDSKSKAVRHAIQCFAEVCRKCNRSADYCEYCEVGVARSALEHVIWKCHFNGKCYAWNDPETAKLRSKTPTGVAKAMAEQWG